MKHSLCLPTQSLRCHYTVLPPCGHNILIHELKKKNKTDMKLKKHNYLFLNIKIYFHAATDLEQRIYTRRNLQPHFKI